MTYIEIKRMVPNGMPNPNTGILYEGYESKLYNFIMNPADNAKPPIEFFAKDSKYDTYDIQRIIGTAVSINDEYVTCCINNDSLLYKLKEPRINVCFTIDPYTKSVVRINKLFLTNTTEDYR